jgi:hypothetical protein
MGVLPSFLYSCVMVTSEITPATFTFAEVNFNGSFSESGSSEWM